MPEYTKGILKTLDQLELWLDNVIQKEKEKPSESIQHRQITSNRIAAFSQVKNKIKQRRVSAMEFSILNKKTK